MLVLFLHSQKLLLSLVFHFLTLFHHQCLSLLLSNIGAIKLLELVLIPVKQLLLLFLGQTNAHATLFEAILALFKLLADRCSLIFNSLLFFTLSSKHFFIIIVVILHFGFNLTHHLLLLKFDVSHLSILFGLLLHLELLQSFVVKFILFLRDLVIQKLLSKTSLLFSRILTEFNLFFVMLIFQFLSQCGFFFFVLLFKFKLNISNHVSFIQLKLLQQFLILGFANFRFKFLQLVVIDLKVSFDCILF
mmetsp:Transcript_87546/g.120629  ORF Transcript_87546/g.120629 Transcript_87546/m.120629 type:complete len:247 (-) Transcript_87546:7819-8559(-)